MTTTVCVTYDFDAVSAWQANEMPGFAEWGVYGADVAVPRLLDLHDDTDIPATWFIPGHTIESFPEASGAIDDHGHEIQHHSWSHRPLPSFEDRDAERADFVRGIEAIEDLTGERPTGFRNPAGGFSEHTVDLLLELGFEWDSSSSAHDCEPHRLRRPGRVEPGAPYVRGEETDIVELPLIWHRDDWMQLFPVVSGPEFVSYSEEPAVFDRWRREIDWLTDNVDDAVYVTLFHPQCAGRAPFVAELETFFDDLAARDDVEFADCSTVAESVTV